jgi:hypothetical protein
MNNLPKINHYHLLWVNDQGQPHRGGDLPAAINPDGTLVWMQDGARVRDDWNAPVVIWPDGSKAFIHSNITSKKTPRKK